MQLTQAKCITFCAGLCIILPVFNFQGSAKLLQLLDRNKLSTNLGILTLFLTSGLVHPHHLDESISSISGFW